MSNRSLEDWLQWLERIHPREIELGLERVLQVAKQLQLVPLSVPVITVAGTNGKGSTVAVMEALLNAAGKRTGAYTSPHFLHFNERIRVAATDVEDSDIIAAFTAIEEARGDIALTYFEYATLAALWVFRSQQVDVVLLEVGLGGRLDAVNIVDATVAVITSIALDHQDWLGNTRGVIAVEKAGILRSGAAAVIADPDPPAELLACVESSGSQPVFRLGQEFEAACSDSGWRARVQTLEGEERWLPEQPHGALLPQNITAAVQALCALGISLDDQTIVATLRDLAPVGRRQIRTVAGMQYVLDVAHNPAAVATLVDYLSENQSTGKTLALFSMMDDKDIQGSIALATQLFDAWFVADQPGNPRAASGAELARLLADTDQGMVSVSKNLTQAFRRAQSIMRNGDRLVVFGSFFTVAAVLPLLEKDEKRNGAN